MKKIRRIKFMNHPVLKNLELDFCNNGKAVDTIIIAGENGTGKSTILNCLYDIASYDFDFDAELEIETDNQEIIILRYQKVFDDRSKEYHVYINDSSKKEYLQGHYDYSNKYAFKGIYSDVDINFSSGYISSVGGLRLDDNNKSRKSRNDLSTNIKQLIIDIQAIDDGIISYEYRKAKENDEDTNTIKINERMSRFKNAFNTMFDDLKYDRIENKDNHKEILFKKNDEDVQIDSLSSGEKQIVFRGCFLLKDVAALKGAFVFIDEPEISLHPNWQKKILDYYKNIFTNENGIQTSQIFVVTHSPFIIHNENRKNDKVIVLMRNVHKEIIVSDKQEYYNCNNVEAIRDAFDINDFKNRVEKEKSVVYLEGRTDEKYFNRAIEVFKYRNLPFSFKWIGYIDKNGQERNTGSGCLKSVEEFLIAQKLDTKNICLYDNDSNKELRNNNNVISKSISYYDNTKNMNKGIENVLVLDNIDMDEFYDKKTKDKDYGCVTTYTEFNKMKFCNAICEMDDAVLEVVFANIKKEIDELVKLFI